MSKTAAARIASIPLLTLLAASCSSPAPAPYGIITGTVSTCPNPLLGIIPAGLRRQVAIEHSGRIVTRSQTSAPFRFRFSLPPGTYLITTRGDTPVRVRVIAGQTIHARLANARVCDAG